MSPSELVKALSNKDKNTIKQLSGVGPKLAERMIAELSGTKFNITFDPYQNDQATKSRSELLIQDATSALANLGYNKISAAETASCIYQNNNNVSLSELIRLALKELSK
jgi:Holliday junction DNA helicase RuvA